MENEQEVERKDENVPLEPVLIIIASESDVPLPVVKRPERVLLVAE